LFCVQRKGFIDSYVEFTIATWIFLQFACFFWFGWLLYHHKKHLDRFKKDDLLFVIIGAILFSIHFAIFKMQPGIEKTSGLYLFAAIKALSIWFLVFGITGLFLRFFNTYSPYARYISDASYWIYLVHLPVVMFLQALLINFDINPFFKFLVVLSGTLVMVLITYNFIVRNSFIGKFLNGRKYAPGLPKANRAD
jgi:glucan biosynthesis protein C